MFLSSDRGRAVQVCACVLTAGWERAEQLQSEFWRLQ